MELNVHTHYNTQWGENVYIVGSIPELGNWDKSLAICMHYDREGEWQLSIPVFAYKELIEYRFLIIKNGIIEREEEETHRIILPTDKSRVDIYAQWRELRSYSIFKSTAFTQCIFYHKRRKNPQFQINYPTLFRIFLPELKKGDILFLTGNTEVLGNWNPEKGLKPIYTDTYTWEVALPRDLLIDKIEYKFVLYDKESQTYLWEENANHCLQTNETDSSSEYRLIEHTPRFKRKLWKGSGVAIPVFSLRSTNSWGIGEFSDLKLLIDWAVSCNMSVVQILPINDTTITHTWKDSYPYNAISIYALHPLYLNIPKMGKLKDEKLFRQFEKEGNRLNSLAHVDYDKVDKLKWDYFRLLFDQEKENIQKDDRFIRFVCKNQDWLAPYAAYSYFRDLYKENDFTKWPEHSIYNEEQIKKLCNNESKFYLNIIFYYFLQYHLHIQLSEVSLHAKNKGIVLKGDIPIGISHTGVEAWTSSKLFHLDMQAGAPPDSFTEDGQNWGFPTYNWEEMKKEHYLWWIKRFKQMSQYFDAYRIDHILGFFRIWEIPKPFLSGLMGHFSPALPLSVEEIEKAGFHFNIEQYTHIDSSHEVLFLEDPIRKGHYHPRIDAYKTHLYKMLNDTDRFAYDYIYQDYFYRRNNEFWGENGKEKLSILTKCTTMLACGEDLGMIPACVPEVMKELEILSLEIERMPKTPGLELENLSSLPYLSVCSTSTHDMPTIRGWWKEMRGYDCPSSICEGILLRHLHASSIFAIFPLQDWLSIDAHLRHKCPEEERINIPSNPNNYWKYRMHITLEKLCNSKTFTKKIKKLIQERNSD